MRATGIVRKTDKVGRIVLPKEIRDAYEIEEGTPIEIYVSDSGIFLQKFETSCVFCGSKDELIDYKEKKVCSICAEDFA